jgi:hypothetical protein
MFDEVISTVLNYATKSFRYLQPGFSKQENNSDEDEDSYYSARENYLKKLSQTENELNKLSNSIQKIHINDENEFSKNLNLFSLNSSLNSSRAEQFDEEDENGDKNNLPISLDHNKNSGL